MTGEFHLAWKFRIANVGACLSEGTSHDHEVFELAGQNAALPLNVSAHGCGADHSEERQARSGPGHFVAFAPNDLRVAECGIGAESGRGDACACAQYKCGQCWR